MHIPCSLHSYPLSRCSRINIIKACRFYSQLPSHVVERVWCFAIMVHPSYDTNILSLSMCDVYNRGAYNSSRPRISSKPMSSQIIYFIYSYQASWSECSPIEPLTNPGTILQVGPLFFEKDTPRAQIPWLKFPTRQVLLPWKKGTKLLAKRPNVDPGTKRARIRDCWTTGHKHLSAFLADL